MNRLTENNVENALMVLEEDDKLFKGYHFTKNDGRLELIGTGGSAYVYRMINGKKTYALKVIGFRGNTINHNFLMEIINIQRSLANSLKNVVEIEDYKEYDLKFDDMYAISEIVEVTDGEPVAGFLRIQLVLMEELIPVIYKESDGSYAIYTQSNKETDIEQTTLKIASDVGTAIKAAHNKRIMHRDIKLENIFYDKRRNVYKLGDFGGAEVTNNGFVKTHLATRGYGAPEVVDTSERYDVTADIYSFGITLYRLLNDLRYPDSDNYHPNLSKQYMHGYVAPRPMHGSDELYSVIKKMCMSDPDDRYQSMNDVNNAIAGAVCGKELLVMKRHNAATVTLAVVLLYVGIILWECFSQLYRKNYLPKEMSLLVWFLFAFVSFVQYMRSEDNIILREVMIIISIYYICRHAVYGFGILLILVSLFSEGMMSMIFAGMIIVTDVGGLMIKYGILVRQTGIYRPVWMAYSLLLVSLVLFVVGYKVKDIVLADKFDRFMIRNNMFMKVAGILLIMTSLLNLILLYMRGWMKRAFIVSLPIRVMGRKMIIVSRAGFAYYGLAVGIMLIVWVIRQRYLMHKDVNIG